MSLGMLWVPREFGADGDFYDGYAIYNYGPARNNIKYDMVVGPYLGEPNTLFQWKSTCRPIDVYVAIYSVGFNEYWLFKKAICSAFESVSGRITIVCSTCNVQRVQALPNCIHSFAAIRSQGIEIGGARRKIYLEPGEEDKPYSRPYNELGAKQKKWRNQMVMPGLKSFRVWDED